MSISEKIGNNVLMTEERRKELLRLNEDDPLFMSDKSRFTLFPIKYSDIWDYYKKGVASFWTPEEIDLIQDIKHWNKLTDNEKHFISHILAYFSSSDTIISENLSGNFMVEFTSQEIRCFYGFQIAMENIHSETYNLLIDTYIKDSDTKLKLFNAITEIPCVKRKANWAFKWMNANHSSRAERIVAFCVIEGVFFSASFCAIYWLKSRALMPGLCFSNELISRDEGLHTEFGCLIYSKLVHKISEKRIKEIVDEAVDIEIEFITKSLPVELIGMNSKLMIEYVKFCADRLLISLGCTKMYKATMPFEFMNGISLEGKTNFFEKNVSNYAKNGVGIDEEQRQIKFDEEF